ncbi:hypothetical protein [Nocardia bovistercoris]|uniref:Uncharacterized protein n=1 Tax=Nocardia bovistercoris TaxID=2785916 RepID=A0A931IDR3_9NOCA|nr:hypothetical protein [Nocardia bovistercoris]MBH0777903.1 hypothetical protein [Nocardia bovistercoris]
MAELYPELSVAQSAVQSAVQSAGMASIEVHRSDRVFLDSKLATVPEGGERSVLARTAITGKRFSGEWEPVISRTIEVVRGASPFTRVFSRRSALATIPTATQRARIGPVTRVVEAALGGEGRPASRQVFAGRRMCALAEWRDRSVVADGNVRRSGDCRRGVAVRHR